MISNDHRFVRHRWDISSPGGARPHDDRDLWNASGRHGRLIVENTAKMVSVWKHTGPRRKISAAGIHEVNARQVVLPGDFLGAQMLLHGQRIVCAALNGRIIHDEHALCPLDAANARDNASARNDIVVDFVRCQLGKFEERRTRIEQCENPFARQQFPAGQMPLA